MAYNKLNNGLIYACVAPGNYTHDDILYVEVLSSTIFNYSCKVYSKLDNKYDIYFGTKCTKYFQYDDKHILNTIQNKLYDICLSCNLQKHEINGSTYFKSNTNNIIDVMLAFVLILKALQINDKQVNDMIYEVYCTNKHTYQITNDEVTKYLNLLTTHITKHSELIIPSIELSLYL